MRALLNSAMEGFSTSTNNLVLSLEDEQNMIAEATQEGAEINTELGEVDRMADMSDALEDLAVTADAIAGTDGTGEATDNEANLMDTAANAAVAGTDIEASEIVPALESHGGRRRYSAESIRERARSIWEAIKKILKHVWEKITSFMYKMFGTIPTLRRRVQDLKKRVEDNSSRTIAEKKVTISSGVASLSANYKTPSNEGELRKNYTYLLNAAKVTYGDNFDEMIDVGEAVHEAITDFDADKPAETAESGLKKIEAAMAKVKPSGISLHSVSGNRFGEHVDAQMTEPMLGNVSIVVKKPTYISHKAGAGSTIGKLEQLRGFGVEIVQTSEKPKDTPNNFEMSTATNAGMKSMLEDVLEMLDILEKFQRGKRADEMKKLKTKLESASDKATASMKKIEGKDDKDEMKAVPYYRALLNFNQAYARWVKDPALPMVSYALASSRGVINVVQKSLSNYKTA